MNEIQIARLAELRAKEVLTAEETTELEELAVLETPEVVEVPAEEVSEGVVEA